MPRPAKPLAPADFDRGVIAGLNAARDALTAASRLGQTTMKQARLALETAIMVERNDRGFEPEALELLDRLQALTLKQPPPITQDAPEAIGTSLEQEPEVEPPKAPARRAAPPAPAPDVAAAFEPAPPRQRAPAAKPVVAQAPTQGPDTEPQGDDDEWAEDPS